MKKKIKIFSILLVVIILISTILIITLNKKETELRTIKGVRHVSVFFGMFDALWCFNSEKPGRENRDSFANSNCRIFFGCLLYRCRWRESNLYNRQQNRVLRLFGFFNMFFLYIIDFDFFAASHTWIISGKFARFFKCTVGKFFPVCFYDHMWSGSLFCMKPPVASGGKNQM